MKSEKEFLDIIEKYGIFTGSRKFGVSECDSDYDYIINEKDLSFFIDFLWDYYTGYNETPFETKAYLYK